MVCLPVIAQHNSESSLILIIVSFEFNSLLDLIHKSILEFIQKIHQNVRQLHDLRQNRNYFFQFPSIFWFGGSGPQSFVNTFRLNLRKSLFKCHSFQSLSFNVLYFLINCYLFLGNVGWNLITICVDNKKTITRKTMKWGFGLWSLTIFPFNRYSIQSIFEMKTKFSSFHDLN